MVSLVDKKIDKETLERSRVFVKNIESEMCSAIKDYGSSMSFEWVNEVEFACPYLDNIVRKPKLVLINDENVVKIEKARKILVASIKDLSKHTNFIDKIDPETQDIQPSKILDIRSEETFNIYENRFAFTLLNDLFAFVTKKEDELNNLETNNTRFMEYTGTTNTDNERIKISLRVDSELLPQNSNSKSLLKQIDLIRPRIKRIKDYMTIWQRSEFYKSLAKANFSPIKPPLSKTNIILKNPNFQVAVKLWTYIRKDDNEDDDAGDVKEQEGDDILKGFLDHSFLTDYFVLDSVSRTKRGEKEKLSKNIVVMLNQEIERMITLLLSCGITITDEQIMTMVANAIKEEKARRLATSNDVKNKFKSALDEYLEKAQDCL